MSDSIHCDILDMMESHPKGKDADLAVFDVEDYREIAYWVASNRCAFSVLNGEVAPSRPQ